MHKVTEQMIHNARLTLKNAYAPYSNYHVSACIRCEDDTLYTGVNVENCSYGLTICAESSAICQMIAEGRQQIKSIVIMSGDNALCAPCGACRQRIHEFSTPNTTIYLCNQEAVLQTTSIEELLPLAFRLKGTTNE
jgi:cytidine deaminase